MTVYAGEVRFLSADFDEEIRSNPAVHQCRRRVRRPDLRLPRRRDRRGPHRRGAAAVACATRDHAL